MADDVGHEFYTGQYRTRRDTGEIIRLGRPAGVAGHTLWQTFTSERGQGPRLSEKTLRERSRPLWVQQGDVFNLGSPQDTSLHEVQSLVHSSGQPIGLWLEKVETVQRITVMNKFPIYGAFYGRERAPEPI